MPHAINWYVPSWDGRYLAYGLSAGGSEDASLHVLDVGSGQPVGEPVPRVPEGVSWTPDSRAIAFNQLRQLTAEDAASETYLDASVLLLRIGGHGPLRRSPNAATSSSRVNATSSSNGRPATVSRASVAAPTRMNVAPGRIASTVAAIACRRNTGTRTTW